MPDLPLPDRLSAFLAGPHRCVVATLRRDGSPHTAATWYTWVPGDTVLLNMDVSRVRLRHLRRDPRLSMTVFSDDDWYSHVSLTGEVREIRPDTDLANIDRMAQHYDNRLYGNRDRERWTAVVGITGWHAWGALAG